MSRSQIGFVVLEERPYMAARPMDCLSQERATAGSEGSRHPELKKSAPREKTLQCTLDAIVRYVGSDGVFASVVERADILYEPSFFSVARSFSTSKAVTEWKDDHIIIK